MDILSNIHCGVSILSRIVFDAVGMHSVQFTVHYMFFWFVMGQWNSKHGHGEHCNNHELKMIVNHLKLSHLQCFQCMHVHLQSGSLILYPHSLSFLQQP